MTTANLVVLSDRQLLRLCDWATACDASDEAFRRYSAREVLSPDRIRLPLADGRRFALMPSADLGSDALGVKLVGYYPDNPSLGHARVTGVYALFDPGTGILRALLEGSALTNLRTAAGAVVTARALAPRGWRRLGIIGSGGLAGASARAFASQCRPEAIDLYSRTAANAGTLAASLRAEFDALGTPIDVRVRTTPEDLVRDADVIVCGTDTRTPVFDGRALRGGQLVVSLGANTPTTRELDAVTMTAGRLFVDSRTAVMAECGEIALARQEGHFADPPELTEIGDVLAGRRPGRLDERETLVFLSTGLAVQDVLTALRIDRAARAAGQGTLAPLIED
jgi:ornithine cyclodeaminase/alanine dehydrogenase-like protein (mu-crystallin family)